MLFAILYVFCETPFLINVIAYILVHFRIPRLNAPQANGALRQPPRKGCVFCPGNLKTSLYPQENLGELSQGL